jgi:hypothetical protein
VIREGLALTPAPFSFLGRAVFPAPIRAGQKARPQQEKVMEIVRFIQRKVERVLSHDMFQRFRKNRLPATARFCQYGHAVFSGNNLCSYGHHAA